MLFEVHEAWGKVLRERFKIRGKFRRQTDVDIVTTTAYYIKQTHMEGEKFALSTRDAHREDKIHFATLNLSDFPGENPTPFWHSASRRHFHVVTPPCSCRSHKFCHEGRGYYSGREQRHFAALPGAAIPSHLPVVYFSRHFIHHHPISTIMAQNTLVDIRSVGRKDFASDPPI